MIMRRKNLYRLFIYCMSFLVTMIALLPVIWVFLTSFKTRNEVYSFPPVLLPASFDLQNYIEMLHGTKYGYFTINSIIVGVSATCLVMLLAMLSAYGYSKFFSFVGQRSALLGVLIARMVPEVAIVVPLYLVVQKVDLYDTKVALIIIYSAIAYPLATWLLKTFFDDIPKSIVEAARIDGCKSLEILYRVILPIAKPALASAITITFLTVWNPFLIALVFSGTINSKTLPVAISEVSHAEYGVEWGHLSALSMITILPVFLIGLFAQKHLTSGLTAGALKY